MEYPKEITWLTIANALANGFELHGAGAGQTILLAGDKHPAKTYAGVWKTYSLNGQKISIPNYLNSFIAC